VLCFIEIKKILQNTTISGDFSGVYWFGCYDENTKKKGYYYA